MDINFLFGSVKITDWIFNTAIQATLILTISWMLRRLCKKSSAPTRSDIGLMTMILLLLIPFSAFVSIDFTKEKTVINPQSKLVENHMPEPSGDLGKLPVILTESNKISAKVGFEKKPVGSILMIQSSYQDHIINFLHLFGIVWLIGTIFFILRLGHGLYVVKQMKIKFILVDNPHLSSALKIVMAVFGQKHQPLVFSSIETSSPYTIGLQRPCIVLPDNLCQEIGSESLESILLHEMSHIYHKDHWYGLIQRLVIALFWWHPMVHTLSSDFSTERESICDNYAINNGHPIAFAKCLYHLAKKAHRFKPLPTALCAITSKSALEIRIKSIISGERTMATYRRKRTFIIRILITVLLLGLVFSLNWTLSAQSGFKKLATFSFLSNPKNMVVDDNQIYIAENKEIFIIDRNNHQFIRKIRNVAVGNQFRYRINRLSITKEDLIVTKNHGTTIYNKKTGQLKSRLTAYKYGQIRILAFGNKMVRVTEEWPKYVISICDNAIKNCKKIYEVAFPKVWDNDTKTFKKFQYTWAIDAVSEQILVVSGKDFSIQRFDKNGNRLSDIIRKDYKPVTLTNAFTENLPNWMRERYPSFKFNNEQLILPKQLPAIVDVKISDGRIYILTFRKKNEAYETFIYSLDGNFIEKRYLPLQRSWYTPGDGPLHIIDQKVYQLVKLDQEWELFVSEI